MRRTGAIAISEMGDWTGIRLDAVLSEDVLRVDRLEARRGSGRVDGEARGQGARCCAAASAARSRPSCGRAALTIPRAGQDLVTLDDVEARATGTFTAQDAPRRA